jgi:ribosome-binding factor A
MRNRLLHVEADLAEKIALIIRREVADPRVGFATVTGVKVAADLREAQIYVSVYGDADAQREAMDGLKHAAGFIQHHLAQQIHLKWTPHLTFRLDQSPEWAERLNKLLADIPRAGDS